MRWRAAEMNLPVRVSYSAEVPGLAPEAGVSRFYVGVPGIFCH